jgi:uncharacterized protein (TIGR00304 family)
VLIWLFTATKAIEQHYCCSNFNYFYSFVYISAERLFDFHALALIGLLLIIIGFVITFLATFLLIFHSTKTKGETKGAGVILIGPFPIIFGTDKQSVKVLLVLTIIITALMIAFFFLNDTV